jgi:nucleotide-binding universal stress UspA family protein
MYRDLIVGYDGSPPARDALAFARRLARATGARALVLHVRPYRANSAEITPGTRDHLDWRTGVEKTLQRARAVMADVPSVAFRAIADTSPARALHDAAEEADAALIVLGATHRSGLGLTVPGTTAEAVIHSAPCAVAIAPAGFADTGGAPRFGLVVAAVDGGGETERVASIAGRIARDAGATLRLTTVVERPFSEGLFAGTRGYGSLKGAIHEVANGTLDRAAAAAGGGIEIERSVSEGAVAEEVARESAGADLLVMGSRGYGPVRRVVLGTATGRVLQAAMCPVLVVPRRTGEETDEAVVPLGAATLGRAATDDERSPMAALPRARTVRR